MDINAAYTKLLNGFIAGTPVRKRGAVLFFLGFPGTFYQTLSKSEIPCLTKRALHNDAGYCDYDKIDSEAEVEAIQKAEGICWAYYEELTAIADAPGNPVSYGGDIIVVKNNIFDKYFPIEVSGDPERNRSFFSDGYLGSIEDKITRFYSDIKFISGAAFYSYINRHHEIDMDRKITEADFFVCEPPFVSDQRKAEVIDFKRLQVIKKELLCGELFKRSFLLSAVESDYGETEINALQSFGSMFDVSFFLQDRVRADVNKTENDHSWILKKYWGDDACFRPLKIYGEPKTNNSVVDISQGMIISDIIGQAENALGGKNYSDLIVTAPTGSGKSLLFQIPAIFLHDTYKALTLVITPLIALMNDQVNEINSRGVTLATFINSELSYDQRKERIESIRNGEVSLVYLSPELLLSDDLSAIIGDRIPGMLVIDEAHLVTSWGRDFRVDYWFLGSYLERYRTRENSSYSFPVLCLTATAVFGGRDDVVGELAKSLNLSCAPGKLYLGYVRRDSKENPISFRINNIIEEKSHLKKNKKIDLACKRISELIDAKKKSIVYFPYISQIEDVRSQFLETDISRLGAIDRYSGSGMDKSEKDRSYNDFRESRISIMLATKAFGMGINIPDVEVVYHYAPTGTLADYVQEIGRAARKISQGFAMIDYHQSDMEYAVTLWGLSGIRHYQIKAIARKLHDLCRMKRSRRLIISTDIFGFLFDAQSIDNKVKSGLMLFEADMLMKYGYPVIKVIPGNFFSSHFVNVPKVMKEIFEKKFGMYSELMDDVKPRITSGYGNVNQIITTNTGDIYKVDLNEIWKKEFPQKTFSELRYKYFAGELLEIINEKATPRLRLVIYYGDRFYSVKSRLEKIISSLQNTINQLYRAFWGKEFSFAEFCKIFGEIHPEKVKREHLAILLDLFCYESSYLYDIPYEQWKFIERKKSMEEYKIFAEYTYSLRTSRHVFIEKNIKRYLADSSPNSEQGEEFITYLPVPRKGGKYSEYQLVASLFELFGLATYELDGGRNSRICVRINDPIKLARVASFDREYRNLALQDIERRHKRAAKIVDGFMRADKTDERRWSIIEEYFLGRDDVVDMELGLNPNEAEPDKDDLTPLQQEVPLL